MTNEEKAKEIADFLYFKLNHIDYNTLKRELLEMAKWKDKQFDEEKKELFGLVNMLSVDEHNKTIIEDLKALLQ